MKKTILTLLALLASATAQAEWTAVAQNDERTDFIDRSTIRREGASVRVWSMFDFKGVPQTHQGKKHLSARQRMLINCRDETYQRQYLGLMTGRNGDGDTVIEETFKNREVKTITPESMNWWLMKEACAPQ